jgi:heme/copper-type cytochrome/quinol oxidase subunit 2
MSKRIKILLGLATLWPFLYIIAFLILVVVQIYLFATNAPRPADDVPHLFYIMWVLTGFTALWMLGLAIFYFVHVFRNHQIEMDKRILWAVILFVGNAFAMPIYWYLYIWRNQGDSVG